MALVKYAKISLRCFLLGALSIMFLKMMHGYYIFIAFFVYVAFSNVLLTKQFQDGFDYQVAVRALGLGLAFGFGVIISLSGLSFHMLGWYIVSLSFFHFSEYFTTACTNPKSLSLESFLLDHSREYHIAAVASMLEFVIECYFVPGLKVPCYLSYMGVLAVVVGECLRKWSMITAATNFNHYVQFAKAEDHVLVTNGVYSWFRHPSYVGWFYWSIGTQIMLCNPLCTIAYTVASWKFFKERIEAEEYALLNFFGQAYIDYQKKVSTGLPLIEGFVRKK